MDFMRGTIRNVAEEVVQSVGGAAIDTHLQSMEKDALFRGAALVAQKNTILLCKGYGMARDNQKNTPATIFQIGSLTKQFTAAAILELSIMGRVDLESAILPYLAGVFGLKERDFDAWEDVSVHHLLSHTSGIRDYLEMDGYYDKPQKMSVEKIVNWARKQDLSFKPGKEFAYSNTGYILLGLIIEKQSGITYGEFLKKKFFEPAEMHSTGVRGFDNPPENLDAIGMCLDRKGESLIEDHSENIPATFSDGAIYSTVLDLSKWNQVLDGYGNILSKKTLEVMTTPGKGGYGAGLEIGNIFGHKIIHHNGSIAGFKSDFCKFPEDGVFITILSNNVHYTVDRSTSEIIKYLFGKEQKVTVSIPYPSDFDFSALEGSYSAKKNEENDTEFFYKNGRLYIDGDPPTPCIFLSNNRLFNPAQGLEYDLDENEDISVYDCDGNQIDTLHSFS